MKQFKHFQGLYTDENARKAAIFTKSLAPRKNVYNERTVIHDGTEYREFNPFKSKLCAGLTKGISQIGIKPGSVVLYLGASTGTTVSHVSDMVGRDGFVFALDFAPRVVRELVFLAEQRPNIAPMLEDAFHPENYADKVCSAEVIFQDIAQRNQVDIFMRNVNHFLEDDGFAILALKSRSIDVTVKPSIVFREVREELEKHLVIVDSKDIDTFEKDHMIFVCKKKEFAEKQKFDNKIPFELHNRSDTERPINRNKPRDSYSRDSIRSGMKKTRTEFKKDDTRSSMNKPRGSFNRDSKPRSDYRRDDTRSGASKPRDSYKSKGEYKPRKDSTGNYEKKPENRTPNKRFTGSKISTSKSFEDYQKTDQGKRNQSKPRRR